VAAQSQPAEAAGLYQVEKSKEPVAISISAVLAQVKANQ